MLWIVLKMQQNYLLVKIEHTQELLDYTNLWLKFQRNKKT